MCTINQIILSADVHALLALYKVGHKGDLYIPQLIVYCITEPL